MVLPQPCCEADRNAYVCKGTSYALCSSESLAADAEGLCRAQVKKCLLRCKWRVQTVGTRSHRITKFSLPYLASPPHPLPSSVTQTYKQVGRKYFSYTKAVSFTFIIFLSDSSWHISISCSLLRLKMSS